MFDQLQEEIEYQNGAQSEMLNCLQKARGVANSLNPELRREIADAARDGRIAIVLEAPYFCRSTDAFAGRFPVRVTVVDSLEEADPILATLDDTLSESEIVVHVIIPDALKPIPVPLPIVDDADDIPF